MIRQFLKASLLLLIISGQQGMTAIPKTPSIEETSPGEISPIGKSPTRQETNLLSITHQYKETITEKPSDNTFFFFLIYDPATAAIDYSEESEALRGFQELARYLASKTDQNIGQIEIAIISWNYSAARSIGMLPISFDEIRQGGNKFAELAQSMLKPNDTCAVYAYGECANLVNAASQQPNMPKIDVMLYVNSPIYKDILPKNFKKLFHFYSKQYGLYPGYPMRKYPQQDPTVTANSITFPICNIRIVCTKTANTLIDVTNEEMSGHTLISKLSRLISEIDQYHVNYDLIALLYDETKLTEEQETRSRFSQALETEESKSDTSAPQAELEASKQWTQNEQDVAVAINRIIKFNSDDIKLTLSDSSHKESFSLKDKELDPNMLIQQTEQEFARSFTHYYSFLSFGAPWSIRGMLSLGLLNLDQDLARIRDEHAAFRTSKPYALFSPDKSFDTWKEAQTHSKQISDGALVAFTLLYGSDEERQFLNNLKQFDYLQSQVALIWYLFSLAVEKGQEFDEGAFILNHPQAQNIYNFLHHYVERYGTTQTFRETGSSNPFAYGRISTHLKHVLTSNFGIDMRFSEKGFHLPILPADKRHLLFFKIDDTHIFIKPENYGIYVYDGLVQHAYEAILAAAAKKSPGKDDVQNYRKERVPYEIKKTFESLNLKPLKNQIETLGIQAMYNLTKEALEALSEKIPPTKFWVYDAFITVLIKNYDYPNKRYGREIILTNQEFLSSLLYVLDREKNTDAEQINELKTIINRYKELERTIQRMELLMTIPRNNEELATKLVRDCQTCTDQCTTIFKNVDVRAQAILQPLDQIITTWNFEKRIRNAQQNKVIEQEHFDYPGGEERH